MHERTRKLALTESITSGVLFGSASIFVRFLQDMDVFCIVFFRLAIACLALVLMLAFIGKSFDFSLVRKNLKELLILGIFLGLHFVFFTSALKDTTILNATVLVNTTPIFSMLMSSLLFKLKPSRPAIASLTIAFLGICIIAYAEALTPKAQGFSPSIKGDLEAVLAALFIAFYLSYGRKIRKQMPILSTMFPTYLLAALIVGLLGISTSSSMLTLSAKAEMILPLLGLGIIPTAIAHTLYFSSLSNLKSFETATMALLEPVGATVLGIILFQEMPASLFVLGAALILVGILFIAKEKK